MTVEGSNFPPPASAESLASLRQVLPHETPSDYFAFLEKANGGQVWFDVDDFADFDCIRIYSVSLMLELRASHAALLPSLVVIGGDQGSQFLGYDTSVAVPWPIVMHLPGSGTTQVATSFTDLERRYFRKTGERVEV
jgi:hypothetical protein